jgi:hypothetical protein
MKHSLFKIIIEPRQAQQLQYANPQNGPIKYKAVPSSTNNNNNNNNSNNNVPNQ